MEAGARYDRVQKHLMAVAIGLDEGELVVSRAA